MVNLFLAAQKHLLHRFIKLAGLTPHKVEIEPGTVLNIWVPSETIKKCKEKENSKNKPTKKNNNKPVVVLVHGFAIEGIVAWEFQVAALTSKYRVYVPDLLFFGGSTTESSDRSPTFQGDCLVKGLIKLGVERCTVVGFSYGGIVAFKMAEKYPDLVQSVVVTGTAHAMTDSISCEMLERLGFSSFSEMLLPNSVKGLKALLSVGAHKRIWLPDRLHRDYLKAVMFTNRKERAELLEAMVTSNNDAHIPNFTQKIHLLWGENDKTFNINLAKNLKCQLGDNATLKAIEKAGHMVQLERPCLYNKFLKEFLASQHDGRKQKQRNVN